MAVVSCRKIWTPEEHEQLLKLAPTGLGTKEIARQLGRSHASLRGRIDTFKISVSCSRPPHRIPLPKEEVLRRFDDGLSTNALAKAFGVTYNTMAIRLLEFGRVPQPRKKHIVITQAAREILDGLLLGDGCLAQSKRKNRAPTLVVEQAVKRIGWLHTIERDLCHEGWKMKLHENGPKHGIIDGRRLHTGPTFRLRSLAYRELIEERARWYPKDTKCVPRDLHLTPRSTAHWFSGDGTYSQKGFLSFCTNSFTEADVRWLIQRLFDEFAVEATLQRSSEGHPTIVVAKKDATRRLAATIRPHLPECCLYKLRFVRT